MLEGLDDRNVRVLQFSVLANQCYPNLLAVGIIPVEEGERERERENNKNHTIKYTQVQSVTSTLMAVACSDLKSSIFFNPHFFWFR